MTTTSSTRRRNSAAAKSRTGTSDVSAQIVAPPTGSPEVQTYLERAREIGQTLREALAKVTDVDWTRESESISLAQAELDEIVTRYCEGAASRAEVKSCYQQFVNAHRGGLF